MSGVGCILARQPAGFAEGLALTCQLVRHGVRFAVSIWLSVLRLPAQQAAAPKCHAPPPSRLLVLRQSALWCVPCLRHATGATHECAAMASPSLPSVFALCWCHSMRCLIGAKTEHLGALVNRCPPIGARHRSGSGNAITELGHGRFAQRPWPNSAVKRTPTLAMASPFLWPVLVPSALRAPAPVNLGVRPSLMKVRFLEMPISIGSQAFAHFKAPHA